MAIDNCSHKSVVRAEGDRCARVSPDERISDNASEPLSCDAAGTDPARPPRTLLGIRGGCPRLQVVERDVVRDARAVLHDDELRGLAGPLAFGVRPADPERAERDARVGRRLHLVPDAELVDPGPLGVVELEPDVVVLPEREARPVDSRVGVLLVELQVVVGATRRRRLRDRRRGRRDVPERRGDLRGREVAADGEDDGLK